MVLGVLFLGSGQTRAQGLAPDKIEVVERLHSEGAVLYRARRYRGAIDKFQQGYALYPEPNLLYNIARAHEALGEIDAALDHYRRCAQNPKTDPEVAQRATARARVLTAARLEGTVAPLSGSEGAASAIAAAHGSVVSEESPGGKAKDGKGFPIVAVMKWVTGAAAVGLITGGAVSLILGQSDHDQVQQAKDVAGDGVSSMTQREAATLIDSGDSLKALGYALLGVGSATAVVSAVLFVIDGRGSAEVERQSGVAAPTAIVCGRDVCGLGIEGRF